MEYLPLPKDPVLPPIEVTFDEPDKYWHDRLDDQHVQGTYWDSFPKRCGYPEDKFWEDEGPYANKAWAHAGFYAWLMEKSRKEREAIMIAWLYFGTLSEVTGCELELTNYLRVTDDGRFVLKMSTESMEAILERWVTIQTHFNGSFYVLGVTEPQRGMIMDESARLGNKDGIWTQFNTPVTYTPPPRAKLDVEGRSLAFERAHRCLRRSKAIVGLFCEGIDTKTVFVISSLHQFLAVALTNIIFQGKVADAYDLEGKDSLGSWTGGADFTHYNRAVVQSLKWCPRTAAAFWSDGSRTLAVDYFAVALSSPQTSEDHSICSEDVCNAYQLDPDTYHSVHAPEPTPKCQCAHLALDSGISAAVLDSSVDSFPLIKLSLEAGADEREIEVLDSADEDQYVAISHVWSHGLGNPKTNSLPTCQLRRIQKFVNDLASQVSSGPEQAMMPFWMDTLCCPITPKESRRAAIMKMDQTYQRASHVLVLDRHVCSLSTSGLSTMELLMQIYRTTWMTRLWTLQEARFAKQLWFQFKDKAINLEALHQQFMKAPVRSLTQHTTALLFQGALYVGLNNLRDKAHEKGVMTARSWDLSERFAILNFSLRARSTSWAGDEAICICNLLGLDLKPILDFPADEPSLRMTAMWKQWPTVPPGLIFHEAPRLAEKGYRWAPSTFVRTSKLVLYAANAHESAVVSQDGEGLFLSMNGFLLEDARMALLVAEMKPGLQLVPDSRFEQQSGGQFGKKDAFLIYDTSSDSPKWYDVEVKDAVHTPDQMPTYDSDGEFAILWSEEINPQNIDHRQLPALLVSVRETRDDVIHVTCLYHLLIARSEANLETGLNGGMAIRDIMQKYPPAAPGPDGRLKAPPVSEFDFALANAITVATLSDPGLQQHLRTNMMYNRTPKLMEFMQASEERKKNDWELRERCGDVYVFKEMICNILLNMACATVPLGKEQKWCVD